MNPESSKVGDSLQEMGNVRKLGILQREWVSAAEDYLVDRIIAVRKGKDQFE